MCNHDLKLLSPPVVDVHTSVFGGGGYTYPPIYQCKKCWKVFKTGWNENSLVELLVNELSDEDKQKMLSTDGKRKSLFPLVWLMTITIACVIVIGVTVALFIL